MCKEISFDTYMHSVDLQANHNIVKCNKLVVRSVFTAY